MPLNDNDLDQFFRDRLRDHSSPVRADIWRRIHTGFNASARRLSSVSRLSSASRPSSGHSLSFRPVRVLRYFGAAAATVTVALAAHLILSPKRPSNPHTNHYSTIPAVATTSHGAAAHSDSSTATHATLSSAAHTASTTTHTASSTGHTASSTANPPDPSNTTARSLTSTPETRGAATQQTSTRSTHRNLTLVTPRDLTRGTQPDLTRGTQPNLTGATHRDLTRSTHRDLTHATTFPHHLNSVILPAIARTTTYSASPAALTRHLPNPRRQPGDPDQTSAAPRPIRTGYISLYGSVDFPSNHYYTWSYTFGATLTIQFSRHWSGTAGFEYGQVNVPKQYVAASPFAGDTLYAFHFENYEVPVLIGYTVMLGNYALTIDGGAILNLYFHRSTGVWVNNWPDRDSYGAYLGADIFRPLGRSVRFFAQPYARYSISNYRMFIPEQRFFYGARFGLRYQL